MNLYLIRLMVYLPLCCDVRRIGSMCYKINEKYMYGPWNEVQYIVQSYIDCRLPYLYQYLVPGTWSLHSRKYRVPGRYACKTDMSDNVPYYYNYYEIENILLFFLISSSSPPSIFFGRDKEVFYCDPKMRYGWRSESIRRLQKENTAEYC